MQANSTYTISVDSVTVSTGLIAVDGSLTIAWNVPVGLATGWHQVTYTGLGSNGAAFNRTGWMLVGDDHTIQSYVDAKPVDDPTTPVDESQDTTGLAYTGDDLMHAVVPPVLFLVSGLLMFAYRRATPKTVTVTE
jgi:hypothetical protein